MQGTATFATGGNTLTYGGTSTLEYKGSAAQSTGSELKATVESLKIDNINNVTIASGVTVNDAVTFVNGHFLLGNFNVVLANGGTLSGYSSANYFATNGTGYFQRQALASTATDYPVGISVSAYNPVTLTPAAAGNNTFAVLVDNAVTTPNQPSQVVNAEWTINLIAGTTSTDVKLSWSAPSTTAGVNFYSDPLWVIGYLTVAAWTEVTAASSDQIAPDYFAQINLVASGNFNKKFAVGSGVFPLPVEMLSFTAESSRKLSGENVVYVNWSTASEQNSDYFIVQRSKDGIVFNEAGRVTAAGNSTTVKNYFLSDYEPYSGVSYYRLKQVDNDGKFKISSVVAVRFNDPGEISVYPNPTTGPFNVCLSGYPEGKQVLVVVRDLLGKEFYSKVCITSSSDKEIMAVDPSGMLASGVYVVVASTDNNVYEKKIVIK